VIGQSQLRALDGLERFAGVRAQIRFDGTVPSSRLGETGSNVLAQGIDGPLLVRAPYGFGQVTFLTVDIDRPPLAGWEGLDEVLTGVLQGSNETRQRARPQSTQLA